MGREMIFALMGPSGAGKSAVCRTVASQMRLFEPVSATTRPQRPGEVQGLDYNFVELADFGRLADMGAFLEWASYGGAFYGTLKGPLLEALCANRAVIGVWERSGIRALRRWGRARVVSIGIVPPSLETIAERLAERIVAGESRANAARRLALAAREEAAAHECDHVVVNDILDRAVDEVCGIVAKELDEADNFFKAHGGGHFERQENPDPAGGSSKASHPAAL